MVVDLDRISLNINWSNRKWICLVLQNFEVMLRYFKPKQILFKKWTF